MDFQPNQQNNNNIPVIDLMLELEKPSELVEKTVFDLSPESIRQNYVPSDFDDIETDTASTETPVQEGSTTEEEPRRDNYFYQREAKRLVRMFDTGMKYIFPVLYGRSILLPDDAEKIESYKVKDIFSKSQGITDIVDENDERFAVFARYEKLNRMVEGVALSKDETEMLVTDLTEILKMRQKSFFSPEMSLLISALLIVGVRVEPIVSEKLKSL